jgi:anti-sigma factor RsiW
MDAAWPPTTAPSSRCQLESRLEELDQGNRECDARLARIGATAAEAADSLAARLDVEASHGLCAQLP